MLDTPTQKSAHLSQHCLSPLFSQLLLCCWSPKARTLPGPVLPGLPSLQNGTRWSGFLSTSSFITPIWTPFLSVLLSLFIEEGICVCGKVHKGFRHAPLSDYRLALASVQEGQLAARDSGTEGLPGGKSFGAAGPCFFCTPLCEWLFPSSQARLSDRELTAVPLSWRKLGWPGGSRSPPLHLPAGNFDS